MSFPVHSRIIPPGIVFPIPRDPNASNTFSLFSPTHCACCVDTSALFPDGPPSPPLPLSRCALHELLLALPRRLQHSPWRVCFDTTREGFSLQHFYRTMRHVHAEGESGIGIFVVSHMSREVVFGCFTPLVPCLEHSQHAFFGTPDTFVFSFADMSRVRARSPPRHRRRRRQTPTKPHQHESEVPIQRVTSVMTSPTSSYSPFGSPVSPKGVSTQMDAPPPVLSKYEWCGEDSNNEFMICANSFFGVGGGRDGAAIFVDDTLRRGTSSVFCTTFGSPPLNGRPSRSALRHSEFDIQRIVWFRLKERKREFVQMELPQSTPCDCGRVMEFRNGTKCAVRGGHSNSNGGGGNKVWHRCTDTMKEYT